MVSEPGPHVPHDTLVLVGDGQKARFQPNKGKAFHSEVAERVAVEIPGN